jgi:hypothetical protein
MLLGLNHQPTIPSAQLADMLAALVPPDAADWCAEANKAAGVVIADGNARGNADHGCCVVDGAFQRVRVARAIVAGDTRDFDWPQVDPVYRTWSGYDGTDATDQGCDSERAAVLWEQKGLRWSDEWLDLPTVRSVDPANVAHIKAAVAFTGPVQLDLALPLAWQDPASTVWTAISGPWGAKGSWGNHRTCGTGYDKDGLYVLTWGLLRLVTWAALAAYALGVEACVSRSWLDVTGLSPGRLDLAALESEGRALAA